MSTETSEELNVRVAAGCFLAQGLNKLKDKEEAAKLTKLLNELLQVEGGRELYLATYSGGRSGGPTKVHGFTLVVKRSADESLLPGEYSLQRGIEQQAREEGWFTGQPRALAG